jgi:hypothetical protein
MEDDDDDYDVWAEDEGVRGQGDNAYNLFPAQDFVEDLAYMRENSNNNAEQWRDLTGFNENIRATVDEARNQTFQLCKNETKFVLEKVKKRLGQRSEKSLLNVANIFLDEDSKVWRVIDERVNLGIRKTDKNRLTHFQFIKCIMTMFVTGAYGQVSKLLLYKYNSIIVCSLNPSHHHT